MWKRKFRILLNEILAGRHASLRQGQAPTLRQVAARSNISPGALSEILRGKRSLSDRAALQILPHLGLSELEIQEMKSFIFKESVAQRVLPPSDAILLLDNWFAEPILCLLEMSLGDPQSLHQISRQLKFPDPSLIQEALDLLEKHALIQKVDGGFELVTPYWSMSAKTSAKDSRLIERNSLRKTIEFLDFMDEDQKDCLTTTFVGSSEKLNHAKKETRRFLQRLTQMLSEGDADTVYKLNLQLFPVTEPEVQKNSELQKGPQAVLREV